MLDGDLSACEIVRSGPSHRLPRASDEVSVRCPSCGGRWTTSERNKRRILAGEITGQCKGCKRPALRITETHLRYWLLMFDADLRGRSAAAYVAAEGLPEGLRVMCDELEDSLADVIGAAA